jgi:hypothetical protein
MENETERGEWSICRLKGQLQLQRHETQHNNIQHTEHNDTWHNDTQHNGSSCDTQHKWHSV